MKRDKDLFVVIEAGVKGLFGNSRGSHGWDHVERVLRLCEKIGPEEGCDMDILRLAALLHDIGREESDKSNGAHCHAMLGGRMAGKIMQEAGASPELTEKVVHCVEAHRFRKGARPESVEARVLFDADKLDSIGAVGVGRAFQFAGEVGARLHDPDVDPENTAPYGPGDTAYREYLVKLRHIEERMLTETGRKFAGERAEFMREFFDRLNKEAEGLL